MNYNMYENFKLSDEEWLELDKKFGHLCKFAAWQLIRKNVRNNHTSDPEDIEQDILIAVMKAGVYYKRQVYIERCLQLAEKYTKDPAVQSVVQELIHLWKNKTRHGANRRKFGEQQEMLLDFIVSNHVPKRLWPSRGKKLVIDAKFARYCKQIAWNQQKTLGKQITKERSIRNGMTSLSDYDYLAVSNKY